MKTLYAVIRRPMITEKGTLQREQANMVTFEVHPEANKKEIKAAIETFFKVHVLKVHTLNQLGKTKRVGRKSGRKSDWKKAIVHLRSGDRIEFFEGA